MAARVVKNDTVVVLTGRDKGKEGTVTKVLVADNRVVVEKINTRIRHVKARQPGQPAGRIEFFAPVAISIQLHRCLGHDRIPQADIGYLDIAMSVIDSLGLGEDQL
ncbi:MAG: 50S ribosomal protein L24, partial [Proteobacteria bacterium]|nr:50S ribosomal protein L24 [Pseudomonadota bacterium]